MRKWCNLFKRGLFKEVANDFATQDSLTAVADENKLDVNNFITNAEIDQICV